jgi:hypothetical protein
VHGSHAVQGQVVVHHGEHALLHLAAVPGVQDDLLLGGEVEDNSGLGVQAQLLVVLDLGLGGVVNNEVPLSIVSLPSHYNYDTCFVSFLYYNSDLFFVPYNVISSVRFLVH